MKNFDFVMIGAMYENGGNTTQRFLDGHPELFVYPFESQLGTKLVQDQFTSMFPLKYRWPVLPLTGALGDDYEIIIDEECKVRLKTPFVSKFRDTPIGLSDTARKAAFLKIAQGRERTTAVLMECFFRASFDAWTDFRLSGSNRMYVGYSPIITIDVERIFQDLPSAHFLHVVRNPFSAYADTKKRAVPLSLRSYITAWVISQYHAIMYRNIFPGRFHLLRFEDLIVDSRAALKVFCDAVGIDASADSLTVPSWNGRPLNEVYPWGTIRVPSPAANRKTALELSQVERDEIAARADVFIRELGYSDFFG